MKALIIEDEKRAAQRLKKLITEIDPNVQILDILDSIEDSVMWFQTNNSPDLIFLDIHLSDGLSFKIFNQVEVHCPVIFTTAYDEYAIRAFDLNSIDYLLKPIDKSKLEKSLIKFHKLNPGSQGIDNQLMDILKSFKSGTQNFKSRFLINKADSFLILNIDEIAYFYSEDKLTFIRTFENKRHVIDESLDSLVETLNPAHFFRINRQAIISLKSIKSIDSYFNYKLKLGLIPISTDLNTVISRSKVPDFKEWIKNG